MRNIERQPLRRFKEYSADPDSVLGLKPDHPAITEARSIFPSTVVEPDQAPRLLVGGINHRKIGSHIIKGRWRGMPVYTLTLEERATCPRTCHHWATCMGNGMHFSRRLVHGAKLEYLLPLELADLQDAHPAGFVVRLHILGDFYDTAYVLLWARWLQRFPALHVFGYTARPRAGAIGRAVASLNMAVPGRWQVRFSVAKLSGQPLEATTLWAVPDAPLTVSGAIVCPAQTGRTECCGTCALCWSTDKAIAFIAHGNPGRGGPKKTG